MVVYVVDQLPPGKRKNETEDAHKPEAASPAIGWNEPSKKGTEDPQRGVLRSAEDRTISAPLGSGKPRGNDAPVARKYRRLCQAGGQPNRKDRAEDPRGSNMPGKSYEDRAHRPADNTDAVDALRAESVQQTSRR